MNRTHCRHGHALTADNVAWQVNGQGNHYRTCLQCRRKVRAAQRAKKKAKPEQKPPRPHGPVR